MPKHLDIEKKTIAISMLCEGNSIRGVERMTGVHRDTIMRLGVRVGNGLKKIQDEMFSDLDSKRLELDEIWGFVGAKQKIAKAKNKEAFKMFRETRWPQSFKGLRCDHGEHFWCTGQSYPAP